MSESEEEWLYRPINTNYSEVKEITHYKKGKKIVLKCKFIRTRLLFRKTPAKLLWIIPWTKTETKFQEEDIYVNYVKFEGDWYCGGNGNNLSKAYGMGFTNLIAELDDYYLKHVLLADINDE